MDFGLHLFMCTYQATALFLCSLSEENSLRCYLFVLSLPLCLLFFSSINWNQTYINFTPLKQLLLWSRNSFMPPNPVAKPLPSCYSTSQNVGLSLDFPGTWFSFCFLDILLYSFPLLYLLLLLLKPNFVLSSFISSVYSLTLGDLILSWVLNTAYKL